MEPTCFFLMVEDKYTVFPSLLSLTQDKVFNLNDYLYMTPHFVFNIHLCTYIYKCIYILIHTYNVHMRNIACIYLIYIYIHTTYKIHESIFHGRDLRSNIHLKCSRQRNFRKRIFKLVFAFVCISFFHLFFFFPSCWKNVRIPWKVFCKINLLNFRREI